ncbi:hypothetical protein ON010_g5666 [Phytophthora cinnamomi]|nr:hypothetical protein ON010_g5666 [Phytophthora cinnamomi]
MWITSVQHFGLRTFWSDTYTDATSILRRGVEQALDEGAVTPVHIVLHGSWAVAGPCPTLMLMPTLPQTKLQKLTGPRLANRGHYLGCPYTDASRRNF